MENSDKKNIVLALIAAVLFTGMVVFVFRNTKSLLSIKPQQNIVADTQASPDNSGKVLGVETGQTNEAPLSKEDQIKQIYTNPFK